MANLPKLRIYQGIPIADDLIDIDAFNEQNMDMYNCECCKHREVKVYTYDRVHKQPRKFVADLGIALFMRELNSNGILTMYSCQDPVYFTVLRSSDFDLDKVLEIAKKYYKDKAIVYYNHDYVYAAPQCAFYLYDVGRIPEKYKKHKQFSIVYPER